MVELVDTLDLKSNGYLNARAGSSPAAGTYKKARDSYSNQNQLPNLISGAGREACPAERSEGNARRREVPPKP